MRGIQVKKVTRVVVSHAEAQVVEEEKERERERREKKSWRSVSSVISLYTVNQEMVTWSVDMHIKHVLCVLWQRVTWMTWTGHYLS